MNSITITGNVGEVKPASSHGDRKLIKFSVAVSDSVYKEGKWQDSTVWFSVDYWVSSKSNVESRLVKGVKCLVTGKMSSHVYESMTYWTLIANGIEVFAPKQQQNQPDMSEY